MKTKKEDAPKKESFTVKNGFSHGKKNYKKGDTIELENKESITFLKQQQFIN